MANVGISNDDMRTIAIVRECAGGKAPCIWNAKSGAIERRFFSCAELRVPSSTFLPAWPIAMLACQKLLSKEIAGLSYDQV
jgi:hypothetical protein